MDTIDHKQTSQYGGIAHCDGRNDSKFRMNLLCLVEISADQEPPRVAGARLPDGSILEEEVEYEWYPSRCTKCSSFGHDTQPCPMTMKWIPKKITLNKLHNNNGGSSETETTTICSEGMEGLVDLDSMDMDNNEDQQLVENSEGQCGAERDGGADLSHPDQDQLTNSMINSSLSEKRLATDWSNSIGTSRSIDASNVKPVDSSRLETGKQCTLADIVIRFKNPAQIYSEDMMNEDKQLGNLESNSWIEDGRDGSSFLINLTKDQNLMTAHIKGKKDIN